MIIVAALIGGIIGEVIGFWLVKDGIELR